MVAKAVSHGIILLGPNCLGFFNAHSKSPAYGVPIAPPLIPGPVGVALQSGALALIAQTIAKSQGVGLGLVATMGNEPMIDIIDAIEYMIEDPRHQGHLPVPGGGQRPGQVRAGRPAGRRGGQADRRAEGGSDSARAGGGHGAHRVGDRGRCRGRRGIPAAEHHPGQGDGRDVRDRGRARLQPLPNGRVGRRMGVVTGSGGGCDIIADSADPEGLEIPEFTEKSVEAITPLLPDFANVRNPLDVTGFAMASRSGGGTLNAMDKTLDIVIEDPNWTWCCTPASGPARRAAARQPPGRQFRTPAGLARRADEDRAHSRRPDHDDGGGPGRLGDGEAARAGYLRRARDSTGASRRSASRCAGWMPGAASSWLRKRQPAAVR